MPDERKPQGNWTKREDESFWRLNTYPHSYRVQPGLGGFVVTEFDAEVIDRRVFEEPFATLEAAQIAAEDEVLGDAVAMLRAIGLKATIEVNDA